MSWLKHQGRPTRGSQYTFSDVAIQTVLTLGLIYPLPLRQAEGFVGSVLARMGLPCGCRITRPSRGGKPT